VQRNSIAGIYCPSQAQKLADRQRCQGRLGCRKMNRQENIDYVRERLKDYWSPDQIAGRSRRDFPEDRRRQLSRQTIYNWLRSGRNGLIRSHCASVSKTSCRRAMKSTHFNGLDNASPVRARG
jgi:IS30 family transposase